MQPRRFAVRLACAAALAMGVIVARGTGHLMVAALLAAALLALALASALRRRSWAPPGAPLLLALFLLAGAWRFPAAVIRALDALPVLVNLLLASYFGATLRPGHEPLIARYTRFDFGHLPPECANYARGLTALWTLVFLGLAGSHAAVLLGAPVTHGTVLAANAAILVSLFLGEHAVRSWRFPQYGIASPLRTCRAMLLADAARHAA